MSIDTSEENPERVAWEDAQRRQEFEHQLIDRKTTWMLTTQGLLLTAFGLTLGDQAAGEALDHFRTILRCIGIALSLITLLGVVALINSKRISWNDYRAHLSERPSFIPATSWPHNKAPFGVRTCNTWVALMPDVLYPIAFAAGWAFLIRI